MQLSIEGQALPDVRESTEQERVAFERLLKSAYDNWLAKPRHGIDWTYASDLLGLQYKPLSHISHLL